MTHVYELEEISKAKETISEINEVCGEKEFDKGWVSVLLWIRLHMIRGK